MKNIIFDVDGTLLDSMPYWSQLATEYVTAKQVVIPDDFKQRTDSMSIEQCATYFHDELGITQNPDQIKQEAIASMIHHYQYDIAMKPGMKQFLLSEKKKGSRMCIFTTADRECVLAALKRHEVDGCFEQIFTVFELGLTKQTKESYLAVCSRMGFNPHTTHVYEDAYHAVCSATQAGCLVTAVYDEDSKTLWPQIRALAKQTLICK